MAKINEVSILREVQKALDSTATDAKIRVALKSKADDAALIISKELQAEFETDEVTKELRGSSVFDSNVPGWPTGPLGGKYGNLLSYFGLSSGKIAEDLEIIKALLTRFTSKITKKGKGQYEVSVTFPKVKDFYDVTPPPSDAYPVSWLQAMETAAVQNFSKFLSRNRGFKVDSRSGTGIEIKNEGLRKGVQSVPKIPYITRIYQSILEDVGRAKSILGKTIRNNFKI